LEAKKCARTKIFRGLVSGENLWGKLLNIISREVKISFVRVAHHVSEKVFFEILKF